MSNDFNTPGIKEHCFYLDSNQQAERFQHALLDNFTRLHQDDDPLHSLNIAIVGGGATGVELSAELYHVSDLLKIYGLTNMSAKRLHIHLIEAGPRILPALSERIASSAKRELLRLGVTVRENTQVKQATEHGFITNDDEQINADIMVWAAGVKAPDFIKELGIFELTRNNQIKVNEYLQSNLDPQIYVLGDCCAFTQDDGTQVPPRAQSAHQMAQCVEKNLIATLREQPLKKFEYNDHGSLVNLSRYSTVGSLMGNLTSNSFFIEGKIESLKDDNPLKVLLSENDKLLSSDFKKLTKKLMRSQIINDNKRVDGRDLDEIRKISASAGILPKRVHGSALFQRGLTQVLSTTTLGTPSDAQEMDDLNPSTEKTYLHHYNFPPYSVGETRPMRTPGRREIGHGALAERAIIPVLPGKETFPYVPVSYTHLTLPTKRIV